jgi:hypothetical protein
MKPTKSTTTVNHIYIIREGHEVICACDTLAQAITASINRLVICGYLCEGVKYGEYHTEIKYRAAPADEVIHVMHIEEIVHHKEEV